MSNISGRRWTEAQRNFVRGNYALEPMPDLIETYEENGLLIKLYAARYAFGVGGIRANVRSMAKGD